MEAFSERLHLVELLLDPLLPEADKRAEQRRYQALARGRRAHHPQLPAPLSENGDLAVVSARVLVVETGRDSRFDVAETEQREEGRPGILGRDQPSLPSTTRLRRGAVLRLDNGLGEPRNRTPSD